jgi:uncharacterized membrane protein
VDGKELYAAVLLVYLQLAKVVRGLTPPTHTELKALMRKVEMDGQEDLSLEEFTQLTSLLLGNLASRIVAQATLTLLVAPLVASVILSMLSMIHPPHRIWSYIVPAGLPTTILAAVLTMLVVPRVLDAIDRHFTKPQIAHNSEKGTSTDKKNE